MTISPRIPRSLFALLASSALAACAVDAHDDTHVAGEELVQPPAPRPGAHAQPLQSVVSPNGFTGATWTGMWGSDGPIQTADLNGDRRADFFMWRDAAKTWSVNLSTGSGFLAQSWSGDWGSDGPNFVGDLNGDGKKDVFMWRASMNDWTVNLSTGTGFSPAIWHGAWGSDGPIHVGDLNGDGKTDVFMWRDIDKVWTVNLSTGSGWNAQIWRGDWGSDGPIFVGDLNGDHKDDVFMWRAAGNDWTVNISTGAGFQPAIWHGAWGSDGTIRVGDYNGDGKADVAMFRASDATWSVNLSTGSNWSAQQWLGACDSDGPTVTGDFNGDGKTDVAVWRDDSKDYLVSLSLGNGFTMQRWTGDWGSDGAMHVADVNGDGTSDLVMWRDSNKDWTLNLSHPVPLGAVRAFKSEVDAVEVTQVTQDLDNTVPLFAGKRTLVRAYVDPGVCTRGAPASASASAALFDASGNKIWSAPLQTKTVPRVIHRESLDDTINFELTPSEAWDARQTYRLDVTSGAGMTRSTRLRFYASVPLHIRALWALRPSRVAASDFANVVKRVTAMYPTSRFVTHDYNDQLDAFSWPNLLEAKIAATKADQALTRVGKPPAYCSDCYFVGVTSDLGGIAIGTPSPDSYDRRIIVGVGGAQSTNDIDNGAATFAQELAHDSAGRYHVDSGANEWPPIDASFPYPSGHITDDAVVGLWNVISHGRTHGADPGSLPDENAAWRILNGVDPKTGDVHYDFMTYRWGPPDLWVSDYTYRAICGAMRLGYFDTEYAKAAQLPAGSLPDASVCPSDLGPYAPPSGYDVTVHLVSDPNCVGVSAQVNSLVNGFTCTMTGGDNYCTATFDPQTTMQLNTSAQTAARFEGWSGDCSGTATSCSLVVNGDKLVTATYCGLTP